MIDASEQWSKHNTSLHFKVKSIPNVILCVRRWVHLMLLFLQKDWRVWYISVLFIARRDPLESRLLANPKMVDRDVSAPSSGTALAVRLLETTACCCHIHLKLVTHIQRILIRVPFEGRVLMLWDCSSPVSCYVSEYYPAVCRTAVHTAKPCEHRVRLWKDDPTRLSCIQVLWLQSVIHRDKATVMKMLITVPPIPLGGRLQRVH